jgi:alpha-N-arabinofuranosidase
VPITFVAVSGTTGVGTTTTAGTASITPTLPTGTAIGDRVYVFTSGSNTSGTTPANWTALFKDVQVGVTGTAPGAGVGRRFISAYYRDRDTAWTFSAFTLTSATNNSHALCTITLRKDAADTWDAPTFTAPAHDTTDGTGYSVTSPSLDGVLGGWIFSVTGLNDNVSSGSPTGTSTGMTLGTRTERFDNGTATGNDVRLVVADAPVTAAGTGTITRTATLSAASQGGTAWIQQTVTSPPPAPPVTLPYGQDFTGTNGTLPSGWTSASTGTVGIQSNALQVAQTATAWSGAIAKFGALPQDYELSFTWTAVATNDQYPTVNVRVPSTTTALDWSSRMNDGFYFQTYPPTAPQVEYAHMVAGAKSPVGPPSVAMPSTMTAGTPWRVRVRVEGTRVRYRTWPAASAEPDTWLVDFTGLTATGDQLAIGTSGVTVSTVATIDDLTITDPAAGAQLTASLTDSAAITDSASTVLDAARTLTDAAAITDSATWELTTPPGAAGTVTVAGTATLAEGDATSTQVVIPVPAGAAVGEYLVAHVTHSSTAATVPSIATPAGWTKIVQADGEGSTSQGTAVFYRPVVASEPASYTFPTNPTPGRVTGIMARLAGVHSSTQLDTAAVTATSIATTNPIVVPSLTTANNGALVLYAASINAATAGDLVAPPEVTLLAKATGTGRRAGLYREARPTAGATGTRTFSHTSATSIQWAVIGVAFRPAPGGGGTNLTADLVDSAAITDSASTVLDAARTLTDAAAITDSASTRLDAQRTLTDSAALTDSASTSLAVQRPLADSAAITDWASWTLTNASTTVYSPVAGTSQTAGGLTANSRYRVRVRARNDLGVSAWSAAVDFTTLAAAGLPQGVATGSLVSTDSTVATNPDARLGINTNLWLDNQAQRTGSPRTLTAALGDLKPKILRYPGGEKSDGTTFFTGTGQQPNPRLNRIGTDAWPSNDTTYWTQPTAAGTWAAGRQPYALQTFLADCAAVGAEPIIVLALDGIYPAAPAGAGIKPTKAQMITNAVEMVRWLNVTNSYGVKYFEIGNEPWLVANPPYLGHQGDPTIYAADFADVAAAMKAIDPTIKVGANGDSVAYFDGILNTAAASVDFLTVHPYDTYGMSYSTYQSTTLAASQLNAAVTSLNKQPAQHRDRIFVTTTETAHLAQGPADTLGYNNLGSAIMTAHLLGLQLNDPRLRHVIFWNTRWIYNAQTPKLSYDAFAPDNSLLPTGRALQFLGQLSGRMVSATPGTAGTGLITYASQVVAEGRSSVLIINRTGTARSGTVAMTGAAAATARRLSGTGPTDTAPTVTDLGALAVTGGVTASITCPANSLTVVDFTY